MILLALLACKGNDSGDSLPDLAGPVLSHTPPTSAAAGVAIPITVSAEDEDGVGEVLLNWRELDDDYWQSIELSTADGGSTWTGELPGDIVTAPGLAWYFRATDLHDETPSVSYLPEDISSDFFSVEVENIGEPLPFVEDFELDGGAVDLYGLGWASASQGFASNGWYISASLSNTGDSSIFQGRGAEGVAALDNWLISPALDFSSAERIQLTWYEYGNETTLANHHLYVSTGSRDPESGDFVEVMALAAPPEEDWGRSMLVELSEYAGNRSVFLAWRYEGQYSDDWAIDDVRVKELGADLSMSVAASALEPGQTGTFTVTLDNGSDVASGPVTVTPSLPGGGGSFSPAEQVVDSVAGEGSTDVVFDLVVDGSTPDNSYLEAATVASDGVDELSWTGPLLVGVASEARIGFFLQFEGPVQIDLGVGDPEAPTWEEEVWSGQVSGAQEIAVDITDQWALLPPAAGDMRWYARVTTEVPGEVLSFEIDYDGETYAATTLPAIEGGTESEPSITWLPEPPDPTVVSSSTSPSQVAPGDSVSLSLSLSNLGATTSGPTTMTVSTADPDVTLTSAGPFELGVWAGGSSKTVSGVTFDVSDAHVDSTPVVLSVVFDDGLETWVDTVEVAVPWPVLKVTSVEIDDTDGDGLLEPGENAELTLDLTNIGDMNTFGIVRGTMQVLSSSTAEATTDGESDTIGSITKSTTKDGKWNISVDSGASLGQTLDLQLDLSDGTATYTVPIQIVLGERPWFSVATLDDATGDNNSYTFDLLNARYRSDGTTFELVLESATEFDPKTAFVEMWAVATGGDYAYYRIVYQSDTAKLQGYSSGFVTILKPTISYPDSKSVLLSWPEADMGLATSTLKVGFGAGWCGTITDSFCDHFPDGWGYYYHSTYTTSSFYTMKW